MIQLTPTIPRLNRRRPQPFGVITITACAALAYFVAFANAVQTGKAAPSFSLKTLKGQRVSLAQFKGKVLLLDFWMPSCPPCEVEAPHLRRLYKKYYGRGLRVVGAAQTDPQPAQVRDFAKRHGIPFPLVIDKGMKVAKRYGVTAHPYGVLIDRKGIVRYVHEGFLQGDEKEIEAAIRAVLAGRPVTKERG